MPLVCLNIVSVWGEADCELGGGAVFMVITPLSSFDQLPVCRLLIGKTLNFELIIIIIIFLKKMSTGTLSETQTVNEWL